MRTIRELDSFRRFATGMAAVGGVLSTIPFGHVPGEVGLYKPYKYKAWHGLDEVGYKKVSSWPVHSSSSNATKKMAKVRTSRRRQVPPTPITPRVRYGGSAPRTGRSRMLASYVAVPARNRRTANRKSVMKNKIKRRKSRKYRPVRGGKMRTSISAGFFAAPKSRKGIFDYYARKGIVTATEQGFLLEAMFNSGTPDTNFAQSLFFGHSTFNKKSLVKTASYALTKMIATKLGKAYNQGLDPVSNLGHRITISYRNTFTGDNEATALSATFSGATITWDAMAAQFQTWLNLATAGAETLWSKLVYEERTTAAVASDYVNLLTLDLTTCRFSFHSKSALKVQNRTRGASIESDAVDNVPIYGKSYEGYGNYFSYFQDKVSDQGENFAPCTDNDACSFGAGTSFKPADSLNTLREPPPGCMFHNVQKTGNAHLDPGMIKTSLLTSAKSCTLKQLQSYLNKDRISNGSQLVTIGKYRFFLLEKMVQAEASTQENRLRVAVEIDIKQAAICTCAKFAATHYIVQSNPL